MVAVHKEDEEAPRFATTPDGATTHRGATPHRCAGFQPATQMQHQRADAGAQQEVTETARGTRPRLALVRCDRLPEHLDYADTGCELSPSCLNCPLPQCKYDAPRRVRGLRNYRRDREIALLHRKHQAPVDAIAAAFGLSRRQVYRILKTSAAPLTSGIQPSTASAAAGAEQR
jgi:hypothetical protein